MNTRCCVLCFRMNHSEVHLIVTSRVKIKMAIYLGILFLIKRQNGACIVTGLLFAVSPDVPAS